MSNIACLKYKEGSTSETEMVNIPENIAVDLDQKVWRQMNLLWLEDTPIGKHRLYVAWRGQKLNINNKRPGAIIGIYDDDDPIQHEARHQDALEAIKNEL
jgi:hypothetical protein